MHKNFVLIPDLYRENQHVYFLGGPIRGADDWQKETIKILSEKDPGCFIACPCRYSSDHEFFKYSLPDNSNFYHFSKDDVNAVNLDPFPNQTLWERYYLQLASFYGSIIFWLPCESKLNPRKKEDGPYARDTSGEIARWSIRSSERLSLHNKGTEHARVNLVIGAESEFPGLSVIKKNLNADHGNDFPIYSSLEETVDAAISLAQNVSTHKDTCL